MRALWLPDILTDAGINVRTMPGWQKRGRELKAIHGFIWHDTVTGRNVPDSRVEKLLRDGHSTLPGPLSQLGGPRDGSLTVIAAGRCHHNGYGTWGNNTIGLEVYVNGGKKPTEPYNGLQKETAVTAAAAVLAYLNKDAATSLGHKDSDRRRKIDPWGINTDLLRARVARKIRMINGGTFPPPIEGETAMLPMIWNVSGDLYLAAGLDAERITDPAVASACRTSGIAQHDWEGTDDEFVKAFTIRHPDRDTGIMPS